MTHARLAGLAAPLVLAVAAVACGGGDAGSSAAKSSSTDASNAAAVEDDGAGTTSDPFGATLTKAEIADGEAWEDAGLDEDDSDVDDGDMTAEFEALPIATDDDAGALVNGESLTTSALELGGTVLTTRSLVDTSGSALLCTPSSSVRQAACWARGKYKGNIRVANMDGKIVEATVYCQVQKGKELAKAAGKTLTVSSGWRSVESQRALYAKYKAGRGAVAAPPGRSHHNCGHAVDFGGSARTSGWLRSNSSRFNFQYVAIKGETWHFENWAVGPKVPK